MKLGPVTTLDKRNKATSKKNDDDVMFGNGDVSVFFPIYGQFKGVEKLISRCKARKTYSFINSSNKISNKALILLL